MAWPSLARPPEWGVEPVPLDKRVLGTFDLFVLWGSLGVGLLVFAAGDWLVNGYGLNLAELLAVAVAGSLIGSLMLAAAAHHGSRHGVPTMVSLRPILGVRGSQGASLLNAFQLVGWASFELLVMGTAAAQLAGYPFGEATALVFVPAFGLAVLALALAGPLAVVRAWLEKFAVWAVIASTAYLAYALATSGHDLSGRPAAAAYQGATSVMLGLDLVIVMPISWWPLVSDYNRFARSPRASFLGTLGGYAVANAAFYALGGALVLYAFTFPLAGGTYADFLLGLGFLQLGAIALLFILVDETDNAFANVYSTAVSLQNLAPRRRQGSLVLAATLVATAGAFYLMSVGEWIGGAFELFLFLIGGIFVPLLGVVIADSLILRRAGYRPEEFSGASPRLRWQALAAWAPSTALYYLLYAALYLSPVAGFPPVGATLPSFGLAVLLHVGLVRLTSRRTKAAADAPDSAAR